MTITICIGSSCHLKGSREIIGILERLVKENGLENKVEMKGSFCMGQCVKGVCVKLDDVLYSLSPEKAETFFKEEVLSRVRETGGRKNID